nr:cytidine deaminase [uncultured Veillonella sp.]
MDSDELLRQARMSREQAYVPYSHFPVGAAVLTESGEIYGGCNIENASFGLTNCAERTAIYKAVADGHTRFKALAVIADTPDVCAPCGACRQVISEFAIPYIILANMEGRAATYTAEELLPLSFTAKDIKQNKQ